MATILIIDDDELFRSMLREMLEAASYTVVEAEDGREGMAKLRESHPDLVITDLIMPNQEGLETIQQIHQIYSQLPIIAVSGGGRLSADSYLPAALGLGAQKTFAKPFDRHHFLAAVAELLQGPTS